MWEMYLRIETIHKIPNVVTQLGIPFLFTLTFHLMSYICAGLVAGSYTVMCYQVINGAVWKFLKSIFEKYFGKFPETLSKKILSKIFEIFKNLFEIFKNLFEKFQEVLRKISKLFLKISRNISEKLKEIIKVWGTMSWDIKNI